MSTKIYLSLLFAFTMFNGLSQESIRIISYNVENLFDCYNDPLTDDDSFTPSGDHNWTEGKYWVKINNLSRAITAAGQWKTPAVIGLCEVENSKVVHDLLKRTQLRTTPYEFIHQDSPDLRGVDVALIYDPRQFNLVAEDFIPVEIEDGKPTRDILHAQGTLSNGDTIHFFVNHWPSRYGGELESEWKRLAAAATLRDKIDSLFDINPRTNIVIMGDFNDYPDNSSIVDGLCAISPQKNGIFDQLYNLSYPIHEKGDFGSHKFAGEWGMLDQIIVSGRLLNSESTTMVKGNGLQICKEDFLLKQSATGSMPRRSFLGTFFAYGFSDHLPIYIDIVIKK